VVIGQTIQEKAYSVLDEKCNHCHKVEKPETIFTPLNMDMNAKSINRQVFIFKTMPKGDNILTSKERKVLKSWIKSVKSKN
jgi:uncharacterized membrane protein